ncbi:hypothetical protein ACFW16_17335 [Inquilinus sp. NPDC058860]|uniref:hypothetical protein n=1 Tax=Inquilinus sp. NPDC058860 TaxID=3346652 RepID=UPI0036BEC1BA
MKPVRALLPILAAALLSSAALAPMALAQSTPRYAPWQPPQQDRSKALLDDLSRMVGQAERDKAASPDFIADLKGLVQRYSASTAPAEPPVPAQPPAASTQPPAAAPAPAPAPATPAQPASLAGTRVFSDDFSDGNYTANPAWTSLQGTWSVDRNGLHSDTKAANGQQGGVAAIALQQGLKNNFGLEFELTDIANQGQFEIRVYQGTSKDSGYRLVYLPSNSPVFALYRAGRSGITQVAQTTNTAPLRRGDRTRLTWTRDAAGRMVVALDGKTVIEASDNGFRDGWNGVMLVNFGGDFALRSVQGVN